MHPGKASHRKHLLLHFDIQKSLEKKQIWQGKCSKAGRHDTNIQINIRANTFIMFTELSLCFFQVLQNSVIFAIKNENIILKQLRRKR